MDGAKVSENWGHVPVPAGLQIPAANVPYAVCAGTTMADR